MRQQEVINILSLDGGGIRGLVLVHYLKALREFLKSKGGFKYLYEYFDLVAGTSTGGLIALGLSTPIVNSQGFKQTNLPKMNLDALYRLYAEKGGDIFTKRSPRVGSVSNLFRSKYTPDNLEDILKELFGDATLKQCLVPTLIPSFDIVNGKPKNFLLDPQRDNLQTEDFYIRHVARATSAAPTYFPPVHMETTDGSNKYTLIDGGVFANNPALLAYAEAKKMYPQAKRIRIISIGTGDKRISLNRYKVEKWGAMDWINPLTGIPILEITMKGQSYATELVLDQLPNVEHFRFQVPLDEEIMMDSVERASLDKLDEVSRAQIYEDRYRLAAAAEALF